MSRTRNGQLAPWRVRLEDDMIFPLFISTFPLYELRFSTDQCVRVTKKAHEIEKIRLL